MAKHAKRAKPDWETMAGETIETPESDTGTDTPTVTDTQEQESTDTPTQTKNVKKENKSTRTRTHTGTHSYAPAHLPTVGSGERKTERLQLVVRPSTKARLAEYARDHGTSSNEVVQRLLDDLLDDAGY